MSKDTSFVGDYGTPEQEILSTSSRMAWETCMTMNDTWGFKTSDTNWKSSENLIKDLVEIVSKGGNFVLNVGPTAEGLIPPPSAERLKEMGKWMKINGDAIYGVKQLRNFKEGDNLRFTISADRKTIYAFLLNWPGKELNIKQIKPNDGSKIKMVGLDGYLKWKYDLNTGLTIQLPDQAKLPCKYVWVLKIEGTEI